MQIDFTRRGFGLRSSGGKYHRYPYLCLVPLVLTPVLFVSALLIHDPVRSDLEHVPHDPRFLAAATASLVNSSTKAVENLVAAEPVLQESQLPTLRLFASTRTLTAMQQAIRTGAPQLGHESGGDQPYLPAMLVDEHQLIYDCKLSLRGTNQWHHWESKPSLRVKIRKSEVRQGRRYVELSRPKDVLAMKNWLPQLFARQMGLLSDQRDHVRLFINRKCAGVYVRSMRPGEPLAISHGRLPGTFFKGDTEQDVLWDSMDPWALHGEENEANQANFRRFLEYLHQVRSPENVAGLSRILDADAYAKWAALMIVTGSVHTDRIHNHLYFISSNRGLVEAIPWDCQSYGMLADPGLPPDFFLHPLMEFVLCDPRWVHRRNQYVYQLLQTMASPDQIQQTIDKAVDRMLPDLRADLNLASLQRTPSGWRLVPRSVLDIEDERNEIKMWAQQRHGYLMDYLSSGRVAVESHPTREGVSRVHVFGTVGVHAEDCRAGQEQRQLLMPGLSLDRQRYINQPYSRSTIIDYLTAAVLTYDVEVPPADLRFTNAITGDRIEPESHLPVELSSTRSIHPSDFPEEPLGDVILGPGQVEMTEDLFIGPAQRLIVRPGTTLKMSKGVGVYSRGVALLEGTSEMPIHIVAADAEPWAAFAVYGKSTAGSQLTHIHVNGGSLGTDSVAHFKGMFNVYNCPQVMLRHCDFGRNFDSDDAVNLAESDVQIEDCRWRDANADGLDLDMCTGSIQSCQWENCGNDGLDLMGCRLRIQHCQFVGNGDKGISVGEDTRLSVTDCRIASCDIGIEVKDASSALVTDTIFESNRLAVHSYQKHWLYGNGGQTALASCRITGSSEADLSIEKRSRALLLDTEVNHIADGSERVSVVEELGAQWHVE